jgi:enolase-phosphatase E1
MRTTTLLLDIEGTTTPISFVYDVLFPYARSRVEQFLFQHENDPEIAAALQSLESENRAEAADDVPSLVSSTKQDFVRNAAAYCLWLMSRDRKSTSLKVIQGRIWEQGFRSGELRGEVFPDVPSALQRWHSENRRIAIYSSGSVLAQQLLFGHSKYGDLASYISFFFDTQIGPKRAVESYLHISQQLKCRAEEILFVSDVLEEIHAARQAGIQTALSIRPGNAAVNTADVPGLIIHSFDELLVGAA